MAKVNSQKTVQKRRTEEEMRTALSNLCAGKAQSSVPPQTDDDDVVMNDCIAELLEARALIEGLRGVAQQWLVKLQRKM